MSLALVGMLPGCGARGDKVEARSMLRAIDDLIQAPPGAKAEPHARLEVTTCTEKSVCALRDVCVEAFRPLATNELLQAEIHARLAVVASASASPSASGGAEGLPPLDVLQSRLGQSDHDVRASSEPIDACLRATLELRRSRGL